MSGNERKGEVVPHRATRPSFGCQCPITKEDDCRQNALDTVELAAKAATLDDKARLLDLAEKWLDLADRIRRSARSRVDNWHVHPLVRKKLPSPEQPEGD
jgi:hypothetical protein